MITTLTGRFDSIYVYLELNKISKHKMLITVTGAEYKWSNPRTNGSHFDPLHPPIHFHLYHHDVNLTTNIENCIYTVNTVEFCEK